MFDPAQWAVWQYRATITNDGINSGDHDYVISPGVPNIMVLLGGEVLNGDTSGRAISILQRNVDDSNIRAILPSTTVAAAADRQFPTSESSADNGIASVPPDIVLVGSQNIIVRVASVAVSENTALSVHFLIWGGATPTVTLVSPTDASEVETENRIV